MVKPFKLDNLKKVSKHEVNLLRALYEYLPATDARDKFHVAVRKSLMKHLGQDIRYYLSSVERKRFNEFKAYLPENPLLLVLGLTPIDKKIIIQCDYNIANIIINKLLGGDVSELPDPKPLTETEQGVVQYLIMQVLSQVYDVTGKEPRVHFRFEKFVLNPDELKGFAKEREDVYILNMDVNVMEQSGFIRLVFADPFLDELLQKTPSAGNTLKERKYFGNQLNKWSFVKTSLWAEAGNSLLSPVEIKDLEPGDVILFDETALSIKGKKTTGKASLHFGSGERVLPAELVEQKGSKIKFKLG